MPDKDGKHRSSDCVENLTEHLICINKHAFKNHILFYGVSYLYVYLTREHYGGLYYYGRESFDREKYG